MNDLRKAAAKALKVLTDLGYTNQNQDEIDETKYALRKALAVKNELKEKNATSSKDGSKP